MRQSLAPTASGASPGRAGDGPRFYKVKGHPQGPVPKGQWVPKGPPWDPMGTHRGIPWEPIGYPKKDLAIQLLRRRGPQHWRRRPEGEGGGYKNVLFLFGQEGYLGLKNPVLAPLNRFENYEFSHCF